MSAIAGYDSHCRRRINVRDNPSEVQEESMVVSSSITGHINGPVTWQEVAVLAIVAVVLYYCKGRYKY
jgi:hypothetical protein